VANTLWTPEQAARSTLAALRYLTTLPRTVRQDFSAEFVPGVGNVVNILNPISAGTARVYTAANRAARDAIVFDDLAQDTIPVTITDQVYKAVRLPDDFATFDLVSLERQVLRPQAESVVDGVTAPLVTEMNAVAVDAGVPLLAADGSNALDVLIELRAVLNGRKVPMTDRYFAVTPAAEAAFLKLDQLQKVNEAGSDGVLRDATLGRLMGFTIVADPSLTRSVAYHRDAFAHVTRPSRIPEGAAKAAIVAQDGFALRWLQHYNPLQLEDQSVVDTFVGAETLDADRAVAVVDPV
jgi:P22 coat protein - gene protein 5.